MLARRTPLFSTTSQRQTPLLSVAMSGVLATRRRIPGSFIERIWIKRATPFTLHNGKRVMRNRWVTLLDSRSRNLPFTGWTGVQKSGYSDVFKDMMRRLRHPNGNITLAIVIREAAAKHGYGSLSIKCCPQCGAFILDSQCCCLHCGMIATYKGGGTELTFSADMMLDTTSAAAAGSAQRLGDIAPVTPERTAQDEDIEAERHQSVLRMTILRRAEESFHWRESSHTPSMATPRSG